MEHAWSTNLVVAEVIDLMVVTAGSVEVVCAVLVSSSFQKLLNFNVYL